MIIKIFKNLIYSILAVVIYNFVIQIVVYPYINNKVDSYTFGRLLTVFSFINMFSYSIGYGCSNALISKRRNMGKEYLSVIYFFVLIASLIFNIMFFSSLSVVSLILVNLIILVMSLRCFLEVYFKMYLNFKNLFIYYVIICISYIVSCFVFKHFEYIFLFGEGLCLIYVIYTYKIKDIYIISYENKEVVRSCVSATTIELVNNVIINCDRFIILYFINSISVSTYYVASLVPKTMSFLVIPLGQIILSYLNKYNIAFKRKYIISYLLCLFLLGILFYIFCFVASPYILSFLYKDIYLNSLGILNLVIISNIVYFCSILLSILILNYKDYKKLLILNIIHLFLFIILCILGIISNGLIGFCVMSIIGNSIKFIILLIYLLI